MNALVKKFFATDTQAWPLLVSRLALGAVILPHGMQKALGMFGGYGISGTLGFFESLGLPVFLGFLGILAEFVGAIGVILGAGTRFMALSIFLMMTGAMVMGGHIHNGFFMNWYGVQPGEGFEYFILVLGLALSLVIGGSGKYSFDNLISKKLK
ncbi:MAG: DoxX family protein [Bacteroidales bacterium]|nr:DoxX family protein [Bacteroidales bacterium]